MNKAFSSDYNWNDETMWNYDVMAPGSDILSTYLNGSYRKLNGTSMATPLVAGAVSRLLQVKGFDYAKDYGLMGDLAMAKGCGLTEYGQFDAQMVANFNEDNRQVALALIDLEIDDSEGGDGDGRFDAGETICLYPTIRSIWGHAENIKISIEASDYNMVDSALEILDNNADFGWSLNSRGSFKSKNPIRVKVNDNANDGLSLPYKIVITSDNLLAGVEQEHIFEVENGVELGGIIDHDMTLYPNVHYIVTKNLAVLDGAKLIVKPGTKIVFRPETSFTGSLSAIGKPDSMIVFCQEENTYNVTMNINKSDLQYVIFENFAGTNSDNVIYKDCIFRNLNTNWTTACMNSYVNTSRLNYLYCNFINNKAEAAPFNKNSHQVRQYSNMINNMNSSVVSGTTTGDAVNLTNAKLDDNNNYLSNFNTIGYSLQFVVSSPQIKVPDANYYGTSRLDIIQPYIMDINTGFGSGQLDLRNMMSRPAKEAHGIVWKVVVDGYDAQDEFDQLPPLGVGEHQFKVFYNRDDIDTTFTPTVTMGLKEPYTQTAIDKNGYWTVEDSVSVYNVTLNITGKSNCDGLNRIKVTGGKDHDHFDIPDEASRYNVFVQAAGSLATGFAAEAGLGRVNLTWNNENNDFEDAMGFNIYRYNYVEKDSLDSRGRATGVKIIVPDTVRLNQEIVDLSTTEFADYEVKPGETYYYFYKVLSTDLKEYDISNVVAATPMTSTLGDANGSGAVDVADVITTVNYAAGMDPKPFIFEAADMNADQSIDILDVIGIIKRIYNPDAAETAAVEAVAEYSIEDGIVYVDCPVELAGVQVQLAAPQASEISVATDLNGFEHLGAWINDNDYLFLAYNMAGRTLTPGKHAILNIGDLQDISGIVLADKQGHNVEAVKALPTVIDVVKADTNVKSDVYDLMGRKVANSASLLNRLTNGIYIVNGKKVVKK